MAKATTTDNKPEPQRLKLLKPPKRLKQFCHTTAIRSILHGLNGEVRKTIFEKNIMKRIIYLIVCISLLTVGCVNEQVNKDKKNLITLGEFVDFEKVEKIKMSNNSGKFELNNAQIQKIKKELSSMVYNPNIAVKVGAINIQLTIEGKVYNLSTATHGKFIEVHRSIVTKNKSQIGNTDWLYFSTNKVNFDNFQNKLK